MTRRPYRRSRKTTRKTVKKVYRILRSNKPEVKQIRWSVSNVGGTSFNSISYGSSTPMTLLASSISQGVGADQRIGRKLKVIGLKVYMAVSNAALDTYNNVRFFLVRPLTDKKSVGGTLIQNIMSGNASSASQWASPIDTDRYKVYYDKVYNLYNRPNDGSTSTTIQPTKFVKKFFKLRGNMTWDDEGELTRDYIFGAISDSAAAPHPGAFAGHVILYYTDN